jgi:hypothetical protein
MDDPGVRKQNGNEADMGEIEHVLVGDPDRAVACVGLQGVEIVGGESGDALGRHLGDIFGIA